MTTNDERKYELYVRRYATFYSFGGGFEGDGEDRVFSTSLSETSRTVGVARFSGALLSTLRASGLSSGSSWVGPWEVRKFVPLGYIGRAFSEVRVTISGTSTADDCVKFTMHTAGNLPLKDILFPAFAARAADWVNEAAWPKSPRPQGSADIDTFVDFKALFQEHSVTFEGAVRGDGFPNAEVFVRDSVGRAVGLLDYRTRSGPKIGPYHRLYGAHGSNRLGAFRKTIALRADGSFNSIHATLPVVVLEH